MKVVILAGGRGTRLGDTTKKIPKPMIKLFRIPLLVHIINIYKRQGFKEFIILTGYKSKYIAEYFQNSYSEKDISVKCVFTGINTLTGSRILKIQKQIKDKNFLLTYGDGLSNVNIKKVINFHKKNNSIITLTAVRPPARFGELYINKNKVSKFKEKYKMQSGWINGGYIVVNKKFFKMIPKKNVMLEREPISKALKTQKVFAYKHEGFWRCIDNVRDLEQLKKEYNKTKKYPWLNFK